jgi:hypothetical protein
VQDARELIKKHRMKMSRRARLGITESDKRIRLDELACGFINGKQPTGLLRRHIAIKPFSRRQGSSSASIKVNVRASKRYNPSD